MTRSKIRTSGAEGLTLSSTALTVANGLTLSDGDVTLADGHGLSFAATSDAGVSTPSELLDDYEEGTWTPTLGGNTTYHNQAGTYTKIGRLVTATAVIQANSLGTGSTTTVSGLPFTTSNAGGSIQGGDVGFYYVLALNVINFQPQLSNAVTTVNFTGRTSAGNTSSSVLALFGDAARVDFSVTYEVS